MKQLLLIVLVLALSSCSTKLVERTNARVETDNEIYAPQSSEQCVAQPKLDWCRDAQH